MSSNWLIKGFKLTTKILRVLWKEVWLSSPWTKIDVISASECFSKIAAVVWMPSFWMFFSEMLANSKENTCDGVSFSKTASLWTSTLLKKLHQKCYLWILQIFSDKLVCKKKEGKKKDECRKDASQQEWSKEAFATKLQITIHL